MVLWPALRAGKSGGLPEQLAVCALEECQDSHFDFAGRGGHSRSGGPEPGALSRAQALWSGDEIGSLPARAARVSRRKAPGGPAEAHSGLVRQIPEGRGRSGKEVNDPVKDPLRDHACTPGKTPHAKFGMWGTRKHRKPQGLPRLW